jgi:hypothetical protein
VFSSTSDAYPLQSSLSGSATRFGNLNAPVSRGVLAQTRASPPVNLRYREYVGEITEAETIYSYRLNPANPDLFVWLSNIAKFFEKYTFRSLRVTLVPRLPSSTTGSVDMCVDFDATDTAPDDSSTMRNYQPSITANVWMPTAFNIPPDRRVLFTKETNSFPDVDQKMYDMGILYVNSDVARSHLIYIEYDVMLFNKQIPTGLSTHTDMNVLVVAPPSAGIAAVSGTAAKVIDLLTLANGIRNSSVASSGNITLPSGQYLVTNSTAVTSGGAVDEVGSFVKQGSSTYASLTKDWADLAAAADVAGSVSTMLNLDSTKVLNWYAYSNGNTMTLSGASRLIFQWIAPYLSP